ncbi:uncharacterized protein PAC_17751 [Phialocephala subalpina]|uniref:FAD dependent oxidoreductase domain-containing protein n=1 Tax=Phialocephala subalpina TaxID=576137 RepID=A0A1L7XS12_9HELO|nr:uncharacterized protein PAC_17751 [Phialocephala subalpina]
MDERAAIPVTLPRANPTISYWQDPPDPQLADYLSSASLPETADVVIIGSGITGSSVAWNLLQNSNHGKIIMLEARQACSGATGRNGKWETGGHTKAASYRSFLSNASSLSTSEAVKIARLEYTNIRAVHQFAKEHGIQCDSWQGDTVDIIYDQAQWDEAHTAIAAMRATMPGEEDLKTVSRYRFWSKEEAREHWRVRGEDFVGAVSYEAGSLSAYKFVVGLLKICLPLGLELYTNTPATSISKSEDGEGWRIETGKGTVKAKKVVLATNGYTAHLWKGFQGSIVPLRGQITAHRPGGNIPKEGLKGTYSFIYQNGYEYMIPRPLGSKHAGDIIIGGGLVKAAEEGLYEFGTTDDTTKNEGISKYLAETTPRYFGSTWGEDHPDGRIRKEWTGIMGYSSDGFPFVGEIPGQKQLWVAASFQGHGMVLCWKSAEALFGMMGGGSGKDGALKEWFPDVFKVSEERMKKRFEGRLHTKVNAMEVESKAE